MQALCGLQGIFDLFNCKTPACVARLADIILQSNQYEAASPYRKY